MPRTVVAPAPRQARVRGENNGDSLPEKLVKYVPAETLAFFVPAAALAGDDHQGLLVAALVIGVLGTMGWLWSASRNLPSDEKPRPHFFCLASVAFFAWALATAANVAELLHADSTVAAFVLAAAVFVIPLADSLLNETVTW